LTFRFMFDIKYIRTNMKKRSQEKIADYLKMNRSPHTIQTYGEALKAYVRLTRQSPRRNGEFQHLW